MIWRCFSILHFTLFFGCILDCGDCATCHRFHLVYLKTNAKCCQILSNLVKASFMMMNQEILMMPKNQVIDSRLQDQSSRIQSKILDSREEIKKQQVKTTYRISIKRFFQKVNSTVLFYKRIFSNFLSYQSDYSLEIDYQRLDWFSKCFQMFCNVPK